MSEIGLSDITGISSAGHSTTTAQGLMAGFGAFTPTVAENIIRLWAYNAGDNTGGARMEVAVHDITDGLTDAPLVASGIVAGGATDTWSFVDLATPVAITVGRTYAVAWSLDYEAGVSTLFIYGRANETDGTNYHATLTGVDALGPTWTPGSNVGRKYTVYAETQAAGGGSTPDPTDVNTDETVELGSSGNVITGTDFGATQGTGQVRINTASDGTGVDLAATETAWSDTQITFSIPVGLPPGAAYLFVKDDSGSENAAGLAITLAVPAGYESFVYDGTAHNASTTETIQEDAAKSAPDGYGLAMAAGNTVIIQSTSAVWAVDGTYSQVTPANETAIYYVYDQSTGVMHGQSSPVTAQLSVRPTLTNPLLSSPSETTVDVGCSSDYAGETWYWHVGTSSTPITDHNLIINGTNADAYGSKAVTATGSQSDQATGLTPETIYYLNAFQANGGVYSDIVTSTGTATTAATGNQAPVINNQSINARDGAQPGAVIGIVNATDPDNDTISFSILSGNTGGDLALSTDGVLSVVNALNMATTAIYSLVVQVSDGTETAQATVTVNVIQVQAVKGGAISQSVFPSILEGIF
jgi:hypothetical protein